MGWYISYPTDEFHRIDGRRAGGNVPEHDNIFDALKCPQVSLHTNLVPSSHRASSDNPKTIANTLAPAQLQLFLSVRTQIQHHPSNHYTLSKRLSLFPHTALGILRCRHRRDPSQPRPRPFGRLRQPSVVHDQVLDRVAHGQGHPAVGTASTRGRGRRGSYARVRQ